MKNKLILRLLVLICLALTCVASVFIVKYTPTFFEVVILYQLILIDFRQDEN